eukprot:scaffold23166_cov78-Phaeocystis_antarctica.AAC.2
MSERVAIACVGSAATRLSRARPQVKPRSNAPSSRCFLPRVPTAACNFLVGETDPADRTRPADDHGAAGRIGNTDARSGLRRSASSTGSHVLQLRRVTTMARVGRNCEAVLAQQGEPKVG